MPTPVTHTTASTRTRTRMRGRRRVTLLLTSALPLVAENGPFVAPRQQRPQQPNNMLSSSSSSSTPLATTRTTNTEFCDSGGDPSWVAEPASMTSTAVIPSMILEPLWNETIGKDATFFPFEDAYGSIRRRRRSPQLVARQVGWNATSNATTAVVLWSSYNNNRTAETAVCVWKENTTTHGTTPFLTTMTATTTTTPSPGRNVNTTTTSATTTTTTQNNTSQELIVQSDDDNNNSFLSSWNASWWGDAAEEAEDEVNVTVGKEEIPSTVETPQLTEAKEEIVATDISADDVSPSPQPAATADSVIDRVDYASKSLGALILDASPAFQGASNVLQKDNDKYAIIPCSEPSKYIIIGLSEDILVKRIVLANYERYSSHMHEIRISASSVPGSWAPVGVFASSAGDAVRTFDRLPANTWARYLKLEFLSHTNSHTHEHYCTITQLSVYGSTMLQGFHEQWEEESSQHGVIEETEVVVETLSTAVAVDDPVTLEFVPYWKGTAPTCPVIPYYDGFQEYADVVNASLLVVAAGDTTKPTTTAVAAADELNRIDLDGALEDLALLDVESATTAAEEPETESTEELEARNAQLSKLLHKFPNAKCLGQLQRLPAFKSTANTPGGSGGSTTPASPNIFTKLSAEIKNIQSTLTLRDKHAREMASCYQTILLDVLVEMESMQMDQDARIRALEADMHAVSSLANIWWRMVERLQLAGSVVADHHWTVVFLVLLLVVCILGGYYQRRRRRRRTHTTQQPQPQPQPQQLMPVDSKKKRKKKQRNKATDDKTRLVDVTNKHFAELRTTAL